VQGDASNLKTATKNKKFPSTEKQGSNGYTRDWGEEKKKMDRKGNNSGDMNDELREKRGGARY